MKTDCTSCIFHKKKCLLNRWKLFEKHGLSVKNNEVSGLCTFHRPQQWLEHRTNYSNTVKFENSLKYTCFINSYDVGYIKEVLDNTSARSYTVLTLPKGNTVLNNIKEVLESSTSSWTVKEYFTGSAYDQADNVLWSQKTLTPYYLFLDSNNNFEYDFIDKIDYMIQEELRPVMWAGSNSWEISMCDLHVMYKGNIRQKLYNDNPNTVVSIDELHSFKCGPWSTDKVVWSEVLAQIE